MLTTGTWQMVEVNGRGYYGLAFLCRRKGTAPLPEEGKSTSRSLAGEHHDRCWPSAHGQGEGVRPEQLWCPWLQQRGKHLWGGDRAPPPNGGDASFDIPAPHLCTPLCTLGHL
jgi:hypothetical protein